MSLDQIMANIYGEGSAQEFNKVDLLKTQFSINRRNAKIRFIDAPASDSTPLPSAPVYSNKPSYTLSGGKARGGGLTDVPVVSSPEYVKDTELQDFIHTFHLHHLITNMHVNGIIVVPSSKTLQALKSEFLAKLKEEGISDPDSKEASIFAAKCEYLKFKNYIFDVFGRDSENNEGFDYKLDPSFPNISNPVTLRRTNRANNVYYFQCSSDKCEVSASKKLTKPVSLNLIGKCDRYVFVFKGDLPEPEGDKLKSSSNVITASLSGGARIKANKHLRNYFVRLLAKYDNDIYAAADEFIPNVALGEVVRTGNLGKSASKVAGYCSADLVHSAMSILFADEDNDFSGVDVDDFDDFDDEDRNKIADAVLDAYTPKSKNINMKTATDTVSSLYAKSTTAMNAYEASKLFVNDVMKIYGKFPPSMFKADVATAILSSRRINDDTMKHVFAVVDSMGDIIHRTNTTASSTNPLFKEQINTHNGVSSALTCAIYNAYNERPFVGITAKCGIPIFSKRKVSRKVIGKVGKGTSKGTHKGKGKKKVGKNAFEEQNALDVENEYGFNLVESNVAHFNDEPPQVIEEPESTSSDEEHVEEINSESEPEQHNDADPKGVANMFNAFLED